MYLDKGTKSTCFGCEACSQICGSHAIQIQEDDEGFRYPVINEKLCMHCDLCRSICPVEHMPKMAKDNKYVFGGYALDDKIRFESTSGGAFSIIADVFCNENYVIFGAEAKGIVVYHSYILDKAELWKFRKSKYSQSIIENSYKHVKEFLLEGKDVLFSGTPCQIAGLKAYLQNIRQDKLLTVEVICEGVPSPLYIRKFEKALFEKYNANLETLDYRYTGKSLFKNGKWDFQQTKVLMNKVGGGKCFQLAVGVANNYNKVITIDRWFSPFWSIWLKHLMSRPSCYECPFARQERIADISLGDLWGVHLYCPELYGKNGGSSLVICNTKKGREIFRNAEVMMYGHELQFSEALEYQSPMRKTIDKNSDRGAFMKDLKGPMSYESLNRKWAEPPTAKLLFQKYIWGNRQKIALWNFKNKFRLLKK